MKPIAGVISNFYEFLDNDLETTLMKKCFWLKKLSSDMK